jgi:hypothetical protein
MDKQLIKILISVLAVLLIPANVFGFFSEPDIHIHSEPFGIRRDSTDIQRLSIPSSLEQANNEGPDNNLNTPGQAAPLSANENNKNANVGFSLNISLFWAILLWSAFFAVLIFLLVKIVKK